MLLSGAQIANKCHTIEGDVSDTETAIISQNINYSQSIIAYINSPNSASGESAFPSPSTEKYEYRVTYFLEDTETGMLDCGGSTHPISTTAIATSLHDTKIYPYTVHKS